MHFLTTTILALATSALASPATYHEKPAEDDGQMHIQDDRGPNLSQPFTCQTSERSPNQAGILRGMAHLESLGSQLCEKRAEDDCTSMFEEGDTKSRIEMCGNAGGEPCVEVAKKVHLMVAKCTSSIGGAAKVGGAAWIGDGNSTNHPNVYIHLTGF